MSNTSKTPLITDEQIQAAAVHTDCVWLLKQYSVSLREFAKGVAALVAEQLVDAQAQRNASNREIERLRDELEAAKMDMARLKSEIKGDIPLREPVYIEKALRAGRQAEVWRSVEGATCVGLVNIQLTSWCDSSLRSEAFADGYNTGVKNLRAALSQSSQAGEQKGGA